MLINLLIKLSITIFYVIILIFVNSFNKIDIAICFGDQYGDMD